VKLCAVVDTLKQEKAQVATYREVDIAAEQKKFRDYRIGHRRKLREIHVNLERAVNEIGMRCLPYPRKGSTIGKIISWFDKEIKALPNAITKVNTIFLVYCLVEVLKKLHGHAKCCHVDGLEVRVAFMRLMIFGLLGRFCATYD
jgi:hypothetical protein